MEAFVCEAALACKDEGHRCASKVALGFTQCLTIGLRLGHFRAVAVHWKALVCHPIIPFRIMSKARLCNQDLLPCDGLLGKAPVSAM